MSFDAIAIRPHLYVSGAVILAANHNENEDTLYTAHNEAFDDVAGHTHSGTTGDGPPILGINSTTSGFQVPRFTQTQETTYLAGSPKFGDVWYNTTTNQYMGYSNTGATILG